MSSSDIRVETYLDDLARMLSDLDPAERDDVLAGIREHLDAILGEHYDDVAAVEAAMLRIGPPEQVAAEARRSAASGPEISDEVTQPAQAAPSFAAASWARIAVATTLLVTVPFGYRAVSALGLVDARLGARAGQRFRLARHRRHVRQQRLGGRAAHGADVAVMGRRPGLHARRADPA